MKPYHDFITPHMLAQGLVQVHIQFDENGDLLPCSVATLLLAELRQRSDVRRTLNKEGHLCFLFSSKEWALLYQLMGMRQAEWADTMQRMENEGHVVIKRDELGGHSLRFFLEVAPLH